MSKVDPTELKTLDRRSTILLQAARQNTEAVDEKSVIGMEDPGIDTLRGSFGTIGSIIRARSARRMSQSSRGSGSRYGGDVGGRGSSSLRFSDVEGSGSSPSTDQFAGMKRHQLWDAPVPRSNSYQLAVNGGAGMVGVGRAPSDADSERISMTSTPRERKQTIKFGDQDVVHQYHPTGQGGKGNTIDDLATHEHRLAHHGLSSPPLPPLPDSARGDRSINSLVMMADSPSASGSNVALYAPDDDEERQAIRTAPARLGPGAGDAPYGPGQLLPSLYTDPFASTSTANLTSFPSASTDDDERERMHSHRRLFGRDSTSPSSSQSQRDQRSPNRGARNYPKVKGGDGAEEEEERQRLWGRKSESEDELAGMSPAESLRTEESQGTIGGAEETSPEIPHMGIRLVDRGQGSKF